MKKTFDNLSKKSFIRMFNTRTTKSRFGGFQFKNNLCVIGVNIGLEFVEGKRTISNKSTGTFFYCTSDIPNFDNLVSIFNSYKPIQKIGSEYHIVMDNFNQYYEKIGRKPLSNYMFKKLSKVSGYPLVESLSNT